MILDDLAALAPERWAVVNYDKLLAAPLPSVQRLCDFIGIEMDARLLERVSAPLPWSRYTHTAPAADKWRKNEAAITRVLPALAATWKRLRELEPA